MSCDPRPAAQLRADALRIWHAAVDAVRSDRLVREQVRVEGNQLAIGDETLDLADIDRIVVVGAGKAGAGMAAGLEEALGQRLLREKHVAGWINVPADCVRTLRHITLHAARPPGVNEPRPEGVAGALEMLRLVGSLGARDLCIALVSGGASALTPAPAEGISLEDKLAVTRHLSGAGANIAELNTVRKQLSRIKGGGLWRACRAGRLVTLVISDVLGDPLDLIASGPTVADTSTPGDALAVLERFKAREAGISTNVFDFLQRAAPRETPSGCAATTLVIGNNATAVDAAGAEAVRLGYSPALSASRTLEPTAEAIGRQVAELGMQMRRQPGPDCLVSGGEPVVELAPAERRGRGGRNQQLVLAAGEVLSRHDPAGVLVLSGGTDGEDGPTDAAGAWIDAEILAAARAKGLHPGDYLSRNDAYNFFAPLGALIKTGPTHTNVCDVRVVLVDRVSN